MTLLFTTTSEADARVVSKSGDPSAAGFTVTREWPEIDASVADTLYDSMLAVTSYINPQGDQQTFTGTFVNASVLQINDANRSTTLRQDIVLVSTTTDQADSEFVRIILDPNTGQLTIIRQWKFIDPTEADTLVVAMRDVASYVNPNVAGEVFTGTFLNSSVVSDKEADTTTTIQQVLTQVFATTAEADAVLVTTDGDPINDGFTLTRQWPFIGPTDADLLIVTLRGVSSYSGPQADAQTYLGTFANSDVTSVKAEDGTVTIRQVLTKVVTIAVVADLPDPVIVRDDEIINSLSHSEWEQDFDRMTLEYRFLLASDQTAIMAISNANLVTEAKTVESTDWEYVTRRFSVDDSEVGTLQVVFSDPNFDETYNSVNIQRIGLTNESGFGKTEQDMIKGQDIDKAPDIININVPATLAADPNAVLGSVSVREPTPGQAVVSFQRNAVFRYDQDGPQTVSGISAPKEIARGLGISQREKRRVFAWFRVAPARIQDIVDGAQTLGNYTTWTGTDYGAAFFIVGGVERRENPDGSATVVASLRVPRTGQLTVTERNYKEIRSYVQRQGAKPVQTAPVLKKVPDDGYYWRIIVEEFDTKISGSENVAKTHARNGATNLVADALAGGGTTYIGNGLFKAIRITSRLYGQWNSTSEKDATSGVPGAWDPLSAFGGLNLASTEAPT